MSSSTLSCHNGVPEKFCKWEWCELLRSNGGLKRAQHLPSCFFFKKNMTRCGVYVPAWGRTSEARSEKKASFWNACYTHTRALLTDRVNSLMALSTTCCEKPPFTQRLSKVLKLREAWPGPRLAACCFHFIRHLTANLRDPKPITQLNPSLNSDTEILRQRIVAVLGHKVWGWFAAVPNWNTVSGGNVIQLSII